MALADHLLTNEHPFWCGPDSMVAPHLPVGSPERAALFKELRRTFVEDWKDAEEAVRREREMKGDLYFIRCGRAVKIGHTTNIAQRLANMQVNTPEEIDCLLLLRGQGHCEREWHKRFAADRIRGEWFWLTADLEAAILDEREGNQTRGAS
jgi:hypothetical protein